jgi:hypothetical protein
VAFAGMFLFTPLAGASQPKMVISVTGPEQVCVGEEVWFYASGYDPDICDGNLHHLQLAASDFVWHGDYLLEAEPYTATTSRASIHQ